MSLGWVRGGIPTTTPHCQFLPHLCHLWRPPILSPTFGMLPTHLPITRSGPMFLRKRNDGQREPRLSFLAILIQHLSERTRLPLLLLLLLKLMETGRKTFCFSNPGFCQANTRIMLKMAAVEESISVRCGSSHHTALNPRTVHMRTH